MKIQRTYTSRNNCGLENHDGGQTISDFKNYYESIVIKKASN